MPQKCVCNSLSEDSNQSLSSEKMTNSVAFLGSVLLLIVLLSSTDGQWNYERWNNRRWNNERSYDDRFKNERSNYERRIDERWDNKRSNDERLNNERSNDGRTDERPNNERRNAEKWDDKNSNNERRNDESRSDERLNDDRRSNERSNGERRNSERSNDERGNSDRSNERRNGERRNNEKSNEERRNNEGLNEERRSNEKSNNGRRNDEKRNDERRNSDGNEEDRLLSSAEKCPADKKEDWSYRGNNGPLMWSRRYPECGGRAQSPVAINSYETHFDADIVKLKFQKYHMPVERATIENNGHTIQITPRDDVQRNINFDSQTYRLRQIHFHWGDNKSHGSEHTINFNHYALEMHLVHQSGINRTAVAAVLFREQSKISKELQNIIQYFPKLVYKDNSTELKSPIYLNNLLPANPATYYWYEGSLTTPPCTGGVQWLLLRDIMPVGTKQMAEFRKLYSSSKRDSNEHCKISNNYRPLQSRNGRTVILSL